MSTSTRKTILDEEILNKIYLIRGLKVMFDRDLAELYGVATKRLNEQVRRNRKRFPGHFMFRLTRKEFEFLRSQNATLKRGEHSKYLPYAFTEHGLLMLANVLKSDRAIKMSIRIIDAFVMLRKVLMKHKDVLLALERLERKVDGNNADIKTLFQVVNALLASPRPKRVVGFQVSKKRTHGQ